MWNDSRDIQDFRALLDAELTQQGHGGPANNSFLPYQRAVDVAVSAWENAFLGCIEIATPAFNTLRTEWYNVTQGGAAFEIFWDHFLQFNTRPIRLHDPFIVAADTPKREISGDTRNPQVMASLDSTEGSCPLTPEDALAVTPTIQKHIRMAIQAVKVLKENITKKELAEAVAKVIAACPGPVIVCDPIDHVDGGKCVTYDLTQKLLKEAGLIDEFPASVATCPPADDVDGRNPFTIKVDNVSALLGEDMASRCPTSRTHKGPVAPSVDKKHHKHHERHHHHHTHAESSAAHVVTIGERIPDMTIGKTEGFRRVMQGYFDNSGERGVVQSSYSLQVAANLSNEPTGSMYDVPLVAYNGTFAATATAGTKGPHYFATLPINKKINSPRFGLKADNGNNSWMEVWMLTVGTGAQIRTSMNYVQTTVPFSSNQSTNASGIPMYALKRQGILQDGTVPFFVISQAYVMDFWFAYGYHTKAGSWRDMRNDLGIFLD